MDNELKRALKPIIYALDNYPVIAVLGARQVGKTTLLNELFKKKKIYDLERMSDFELIERDPEFFLDSQELPIVIDEAQLSTKLFSAIRVFVDKNRKQSGQIIISGSSSPLLLKNVTDSLAGRIGIVELPPLSLAEIEVKESSLFYKILKDKDNEKLLKLKVEARKWSDAVWWGGYPEPVVKHDPEFKNDWSENYIRSYIDRDIRRLFPELQMDTYQRFIRMLALSSGEIINYAAWSSALGVSEPTAKKYLDIAVGTFIFRKLDGHAFHPTKRLIKSPKGYLRDTGLLTALLRIEAPDDLFAHPRSGYLFESFVVEQIIKGFNSERILAGYSFYQTKDKKEIDLVIDFSKHKIPIEIKLGKECRAESLNSLKSFIKDYHCPFGIIINNSDEVRMVAQDIIQIPFGSL